MTAYPWDLTPTHQPDLTEDEWVAIREEITDAPWDDPARYPDCIVEAIKTLGEVGMGGDPYSRRIATQCLRSMAYRSRNGVPFHEPVEPADSCDPDRRLPRSQRSDDEVTT